jgi:hypothetical protein
MAAAELRSLPHVVLARRVAAVLSLALATLAATGDGRQALLACAAGLGVSWFSHAFLVHGLVAAFSRSLSRTRGQAWTATAFVVRHGITGAALWALVPHVSLGWLLVGFSAWPAAHLIVGLSGTGGWHAVDTAADATSPWSA